MKRLLMPLMAALLAFGLVVPAAIGGPSVLKNKYSVSDVVVACTDSNGVTVGTVTYSGPLKMWPPNHKYTPVTITADAVDAGDSVTLSTEGYHDETVDGEEMNGAGNTDSDVSPAAASNSGVDVAQTAHQLRSERSGRGDGRVYTLDWQATFTNDADTNPSAYTEVVCGSADLNDSGFDPNQDAFVVTVPHDMRGGADWKSTGNDEETTSSETESGKGNGNGKNGG